MSFRIKTTMDSRFRGNDTTETEVYRSKGITTTLAELIALRPFAQGINLRHWKTPQALRNGTKKSRLRGRGMAFAETRLYQAGDDIRHMDWRVTARTGIPHTKLYEEERERPVFLAIDFSSTMYFGTRVAFKSVVAAQIAALLGWSCIHQGDRLGALMFSAEQHVELRPKLRQAGITPLLHELVNFSQQIPKNNSVGGLTRMLMRARHVIKPGSLVIFLSDFYQWTKEDEHYLASIAQHNQLLAIVIRDTIESVLPPPNYYSMTDGQQYLEVDWTNKPFRQLCEQQLQHEFEQLTNMFQRHFIPFLRIFTNESSPQNMQQIFRGQYG